jgi:hypothetical protein
VGGDPVSAAVARVQHELVLRYRDVRTHGSGRQNARAFGISQSVWTRALAGERFLGETVTAALLHGVHGW